MIPIAKPTLGKEEKNAIIEVLNSGMIAQGQKVTQFEKEFAEFIGVKHAIAVNSGTSALHCCLEGIKIKRGDEVIVPAFTFGASANSVLMQGAKPVFADINEKTFTIDLNSLQEKITPKTKAIMPVHIFGQMADMDEIMEIAGEKIKVIEDSAQAHGAMLGNKKAGSIGDASAFSFYATKNMTTGEGGMVTTDDEEIAERVKLFRHHGQSEKHQYAYVSLGYNYRMTDLMASIGICQLKKIERNNNKRIENAKILSKKISKIKGISVPYIKKNIKHVFHQYSILVSEDFAMTRDELVNYLKSNGIGCSVFYPTPMHLQPLYFKKTEKLPVAEKISKMVLSLPVHPGIGKKEIIKICNVIKSAEKNIRGI